MAFIMEGYPTRMTFSASASAALYFKVTEVQPFGFDGGGPNDVTNMDSTTYREYEPKVFIAMTPATLTCFYDPAILDEVRGMINVKQQITITFPDTSTYVVWGYIDKFNAAAIKEGAPASATITVQPTNRNTSGTVVNPVYTPA